jgi:Domain of unknown function (DUF4783)
MKTFKNTFFAFITTALMTSFVLSDAMDVAIAERIKTSIKTGDSHELANHFDRKLELIIDAEQVSFRNVDTKQAELILKSFFKKYPPKDFRFVFQGTASKVKYCTATYQSGGTAFQVYILMRQNDNKLLINTLHFKKE